MQADYLCSTSQHSGSNLGLRSIIQLWLLLLLQVTVCQGEQISHLTHCPFFFLQSWREDERRWRDVMGDRPHFISDRRCSIARFKLIFFFLQCILSTAVKIVLSQAVAEMWKRTGQVTANDGRLKRLIPSPSKCAFDSTTLRFWWRKSTAAAAFLANVQKHTT